MVFRDAPLVVWGASLLHLIIGGLLVDSISWRAAFLVNVPFIVAALYATRHIEESRDISSSGRFDWVGSLITAFAVGGLAFGAIYGQQRAGRSLQDAEENERLEVRRETAQHRGHPEAGDAELEHALASVVVVGRSGQDQQRGQRQEVAVVDVGLALEDAQEQGRKVLPDPRERDGDDRRVDEDESRAEDRGHEDPALVCAQCAAPSQAISPASMRTSSRLSGPASGQDQR